MTAHLCQHNKLFVCLYSFSNYLHSKLSTKRNNSLQNILSFNLILCSTQECHINLKNICTYIF